MSGTGRRHVLHRERSPPKMRPDDALTLAVRADAVQKRAQSGVPGPTDVGANAGRQGFSRLGGRRSQSVALG